METIQACCSFNKDGIHVAGTSHHNIKDIELEIQPDDFLIFKREPKNPHDKFAIAIFTELEKKLGYIPKEKNEILARLMDSGKLIFGKIVSKKWINNWLKIEIKIFMREI